MSNLDIRQLSPDQVADLRSDLMSILECIEERNDANAISLLVDIRPVYFAANDLVNNKFILRVKQHLSHGSPAYDAAKVLVSEAIGELTRELDFQARFAMADTVYPDYSLPNDYDNDPRTDLVYSALYEVLADWLHGDTQDVLRAAALEAVKACDKAVSDGIHDGLDRPLYPGPTA